MGADTTAASASTADLRTVTLPSGKTAEYDANCEIGALRSLFNAASKGDFDSLIGSLALIVKKWPYKGDPTSAAAWDKLRRAEFNEVVQGVLKDLGSLGEA